MSSKLLLASFFILWNQIVCSLDLVYSHSVCPADLVCSQIVSLHTFGGMYPDNRPCISVFCSPGYGRVNDNCVICQRGYYNDNSGLSRFNVCTQCPQDSNGRLFTDREGAISVQNCTSCKFLFAFLIFFQ